MEYVKSCQICQIAKFKFRARPDTMIVTNDAISPFECLHLDFAERKKKAEGSAKTQSFLVAVDEFSRVVFAKAMKEGSRAVINFLQNFPHIQKVKKIVSDNGPQFVSREMSDFASKRGIYWVTSAPYHPEANGLAERKIRDIKQFLLPSTRTSEGMESLPTSGCRPHESLSFEGNRVLAEL